MIAYCGPAAVPTISGSRWNFDPLLIAGHWPALAIGRSRSSNARAGWAAIALMVIIFVSPLCALSSALFSARVFHHVVLVAAVAPLLALAFPLRRAGSLPLSALVATHAIILWLWHAPGPYEWGLATVPAYWLMQGSLLGERLADVAGDSGASAARCGADRARGDDRADGPARRTDRIRAAATLCGAFREHVALGTSPLADQQLAGLLMWVPAILPYLGVGLWLAWSSLRPGEPAR